MTDLLLAGVMTVAVVLGSYALQDALARFLGEGR